MKKIRIIHTNDIHSKFEPFEKMAFVVDDLKTGNDIILDGGDFNDFSDIVTYGSNGKAGLELLNMLGYDALSIGNNEGFQSIDKIEKMCNYNLINLLSINLVKSDGSKINGLKGSIIKEVDNERFLIIGVSPYKETYQTYYSYYNIKAIEPYDLIRKEIKDKKGLFDHVILLSHIGLAMDIKTAQIIDDIDVVISSHTHVLTEVYNINNTLIHQSGVRGNAVGYIDLFIENHKIVDYHGENILIDKNTDINNKIKDKYELIKKEALIELSKTIGQINEDLVYSVDNECNISNLICDYLFEKYDGDFSLINTGLTEKNINKGNVSTLDVLNSCNSPIYINNIFIKGKYIIQALNKSTTKEKCEENIRRPGFRGVFLGFLCVSKNVSINKKDDNLEVFIDGKKIENEKVYNVISTDYFYNGRGYEDLGNNEGFIGHSETIYEALIHAIESIDSYKEINKRRWRN